MSDLLREYERKRGRAMYHFDVLRKEVEGFSDAHSDPVQGEFDADASKYVFKVPLKVNPDWTLRLGEFAYNTRASLDYLITALVRSMGKEENDRNQFPIYSIDFDRAWMKISQVWDSSGRISQMLENTPPGTRAALKQLQPFYGVPIADPFRHPLWALNLMNNRDKHRRLNLLATNASVEFIDTEGKPIFHGPPLPTRITQSRESDAYTVTLTVTPDYANVDMYLLAAHKVALHEPPHLIGELVETLTGINQFVDTRVVPAVRALL